MKRLFLSILFALAITMPVVAWGATYPATFDDDGSTTIDGDTFCSGVCQPDDIITLEAATTSDYVLIQDMHGTSGHPIIIRNADNSAAGGGTVIDCNYANLEGYSGFKIINSTYFKLDGSGDADVTYGIKITENTARGLYIDYNYGPVNNYEIQYVEITNIISSTNAIAAGLRISGGSNVSIHNCRIYNTSGEGMYLGTAPSSPYTVAGCAGKALTNLEVYSNSLEDTGLDGIDVKCATGGAIIRNNTILNPGMRAATVKPSDDEGISVATGSVTVVHSNYIEDAHGMAIRMAAGVSGQDCYNNVIVNPYTGIGADRNDGGESGSVLVRYNTIINPALATYAYGIYYSSTIPGNIAGNLIVNENGLAAGKVLEDGAATASGNVTKATIAECNFTNAATDDYSLTATTPVSILDEADASFSPSVDYAGTVRPKNGNPDVGAFEYDPGTIEDFPGGTAATCATLAIETDSDAASTEINNVDAKTYRGPKTVAGWANVCRIEARLEETGNLDGQTIYIAKATKSGDNLNVITNLCSIAGASISTTNWYGCDIDYATIASTDAVVIYSGTAADGINYLKWHRSSTDLTADLTGYSSWASNKTFGVEYTSTDLNIRIYTGTPAVAVSTTRPTVTAIGYWEAGACNAAKTLAVTSADTALSLCVLTDSVLSVSVPGENASPYITMLPGPAVATEGTATYTGYATDGTTGKTALLFSYITNVGERAADLSVKDANSLVLGLGTAIAITSITKANPGVVTTAAAHGLVDGDYVFFNNLGEMTELEHKACVVNATGDTTFEIYDVSGYAAAESDGGTEQCQKVNALVIDTSYNLLDPDLTAAGSDIGAISLTIPWPDTNPLRIPDDYATLTAAIAAGITLIAGDNITIASGTTEPGALDLSGDDGTAGTEIVFTLEGDWTLAAGGLILGDYYIINCQGNSIIGPITFGDNVTSSKCQFKPE